MSNVTAKHVEATGTVLTGRYNLRGFLSLSGGTSGDVIFRDGGSGGTIKLQYNIGTSSNHIDVTLPSDGILFVTDIYVTLPTNTKTTVFVESV
jgi:hypothetical protein